MENYGNNSIGGFMIENSVEKVCIGLKPKFKKKVIQCVDYIVKVVPDVEEIYLFGSCARGEAKWNSDVDIAIVTEERITDRTLRGTVQCELEWLNEDGVKADVIFRAKDTQDWNKVFEELYNEDKKLVWRRVSDRK